MCGCMDRLNFPVSAKIMKRVIATLAAQQGSVASEFEDAAAEGDLQRRVADDG